MAVQPLIPPKPADDVLVDRDTMIPVHDGAQLPPHRPRLTPISASRRGKFLALLERTHKAGDGRRLQKAGEPVGKNRLWHVAQPTLFHDGDSPEHGRCPPFLRSSASPG
jgi:hypothetical protein